MKRTLSILITGILLLTGNAISAQQQSAKGKPMYKEFRMYYEQNIKPVLIEQQDKYMGVLNNEEKDQLKEIKQQWKTVHESMKGKVPPEDRESTQKSHFEAFNTQVEQIADAHPKMKKEYIDVMTPKKEQWQKDIKAIREENNLPENNKTTYLDRVNDPAFILMWDRNRDMQQNRSKQAMKNTKTQNQKAMQPGIHVFPQPAAGTANIKITGAKNKMVTAGIYDASGREIKGLFKAKATIPVLNFSFDVSEWNNGIYTVKVKLDDRNMTMDFKVEK